jgi:tetratricopeptide (TPR) repeat protein
VRVLVIIVLFLSLAPLSFAAAGEAAREPTAQELEHRVALYSALLKNDAGNARNLNALGFAYYRLGRLDEAMASYEKAVAADPGYAVTFNNIGVIELNRNDYEDAEKSFRTALRLDARYAKAAYNLAIALYRQSRYLEAYRAYRQAKQIDAGYVKQRMTGPGSREKIDQEFAAKGDGQEVLRALSRELDEKP